MFSEKFSARQYLSIFVLSVVALVSILPMVLEAHSQGFSFEEERGEYFVDVGYSDSPILSNTQIRFDFSLYEAANQEVPVEFTNVWVRLEGEDSLYFAGAVHEPIFGTAGFSYQFADPGSYTLFVRYENATTALAESSFDFTVNSSGGGGNSSLWLVGLASLLVGAAGAYLLVRARSGRSTDTLTT